MGAESPSNDSCFRVPAWQPTAGRSGNREDGLTRQQEAIRGYAGEHNIQIVETFRKKGVSGGTELENRPALLELLAALKTGGIGLVLIEKLDRLARDLMVQETIIGDLRKRGFQLISATEPDLLQNDPTRVLMRQVFGAIGSRTGEKQALQRMRMLRGTRL